MDRKKLDGPIRDFDTDSYDDVQFILKSEIVKKEPEAPKQPYSAIEQVINSSIDEDIPDAPLIAGTKMLKYFKDRFLEVNGYEYVSDDDYDINIFEDFKSRYEANAIPMIKVLFDDFGGSIKEVDGPLTANAFKRNAKWIQDKLYTAVQEKKKNNSDSNKSTKGLMDSAEFLRIVSMGK